ncbi:hypothetical protein BC834DRAFT_976124 [Gloeopeniophorella convolvens]|nr:hypothetical protein BC834DRAFT_976124 [Gloeopeniophorella convolvens]
MTNWQDPARVTTDYMALIKLAHVTIGILIWELVINLPFNISIFTGKRKVRWTFMLYLGCRWWPILCVAIMLVGLDVSHKINCVGWIVSVFSFAYLSLIFASALIVLRISAIWDYNKFAMGLASLAWLASTGSYIYCMYTLPTPEAETNTRTLSGDHSSRGVNILIVLATDVCLLGLVLGGLLRWNGEWSARGIRRFLYNQGLIWLVVVTLSDVPMVVFILLDLNGAYRERRRALYISLLLMRRRRLLDPLNLMAQVPALVMMALGAAHIYRGLAEYSSQDIMCTTGAEFGRASERLVFAPGVGSGSRPVPAPDASSEQTLSPLVHVIDSLPAPDVHSGDKMTKLEEAMCT